MTSYLRMATVREKVVCVLRVFETKSVIEMHCRYRTECGIDPLSDNDIRRWLKQFQETANVLHRKGAGRPSTSHENVDRIQEEFSRSPQKSIRRVSLQLGIPQATVWRAVHNYLYLLRQPRQ
jgi:hypothetical protein